MKAFEEFLLWAGEAAFNLAILGGAIWGLVKLIA